VRPHGIVPDPDRGCAFERIVAGAAADYGARSGDSRMPEPAGAATIGS
jgi:hypothetical protein